MCLKRDSVKPNTFRKDKRPPLQPCVQEYFIRLYLDLLYKQYNKNVILILKPVIGLSKTGVVLLRPVGASKKTKQKKTRALKSRLNYFILNDSAFW